VVFEVYKSYLISFCHTRKINSIHGLKNTSLNATRTCLAVCSLSAGDLALRKLLKSTIGIWKEESEPASSASVARRRGQVPWRQEDIRLILRNIPTQKYINESGQVLPFEIVKTT
jgi:hypothetical protein